MSTETDLNFKVDIKQFSNVGLKIQLFSVDIKHNLQMSTLTTTPSYMAFGDAE